MCNRVALPGQAYQTGWPSTSQNKGLLITATVIVHENCYYVVVHEVVSMLSVSSGVCEFNQVLRF
jgi:hypothetical protein